MTESVLQQQAAKCREAQRNLDEAHAACGKQCHRVNTLKHKIDLLEAELQDEEAKLVEVSLIRNFASQAVNTTIEEMRRILDKAMPYGAGRMSERCAKDVDTYGGSYVYDKSKVFPKN
jgi:hypothetical protein